MNAPVPGRPGRGRRLELRLAAPAPAPARNPPGPHADADWKARLVAYEAKVAAGDAERARTIDFEPGVDFESPWVRQMGWAAHLAGRDMAELRRAAEPALSTRELAKLSWTARKERGDSEAALVRLGQSFDREIERYSRRISQVPVETLC